MGFGSKQASHRGTLAYTAYLGLINLSVSHPKVMEPKAIKSYMRFLRDLFTNLPTETLGAKFDQ